MTELETAFGLTQRMIENEAAIELLDALYGRDASMTPGAAISELFMLCGYDYEHTIRTILRVTAESVASGAMQISPAGELQVADLLSC